MSVPRRKWAALLLLGTLGSCGGGPAYSLEPAYAGKDREGYRVIVYVPSEDPVTISRAAEEQARSFNVCPKGISVYDVTRRQPVRTIPGNWVLNVTIACKIV